MPSPCLPFKTLYGLTNRLFAQAEGAEAERIRMDLPGEARYFRVGRTGERDAFLGFLLELFTPPAYRFDAEGGVLFPFPGAYGTPEEAMRQYGGGTLSYCLRDRTGTLTVVRDGVRKPVTWDDGL